MAGQDIGFLNFGLGGDDKELKKILDENLKGAVKLSDVLGNMRVGVSGKTLENSLTKASLQADKLAISTNKVQKSEESLLNTKKQGESIVARTTKLNEEASVSVARRVMIEQDAANKKNQAQQRELINAAKLEGINKRNALIGVRNVRDLNTELSKQDSIVQSLTRNAAAYFSAYKVAQFAKEIVNVRGEFQGLELAFTTMLGSAEKSRQMMADVTRLALESPYTVSDVATNAKQLIAMGIEAEKVMDTMKALGDVSAGLSVPMWRIAINYGQVSALGRLQAREIRDFAMAGVPIVAELAKQLGKTTAEITDMVSAGKIGFPEVEKAFQSMAGEGGKFNNMMEKRNSTVKGQMNRLEDQVQLMMNAIGKSNEGVIYGAIDAASNLVENYEAVGKTIMGLVAVYGTYRAILMASNVLLNIHSQMALQAALSTNTLTASQQLGAVAASNWSRAMKALNASVLANPYVLAASAVVMLGWAVWELYDATTAQEKAQEHLNNLINQVEKKKDELTTTTRQLISEVNSETESVNKQLESYKKLQSIYPEILKNMDLQAFKAKNAAEQMKMFVDSINSINDFNTDERIDRITKLIDKTKRDRERGLGNVNTSTILDELGVNSAWDRAKYTNAKALKELEALLIELGNKSKKEKEIQKEIEETPFFTFEQQVSLAKSEVKDLNKELESLKKGIAPSTLKKGEQFDFAKGIEDKAKELKDAEEKLNLLQNGKKKVRPEREFKDPEVTKLEKRIDLLKTARSEYEKLSKVMSNDSAFAEIAKNPAFKGISQADLSNDGFIKSIDEMIAAVSKLKVSDKRDKLLASLTTVKTDAGAKMVKELADSIERELQQYKGKYDLYEQLLGITNNEQQAQQLVFGNADEAIKSYRDNLKEAIDKTEDKELKKKLQDQLFSFDTSEQENFLKEMAKMLAKYQTVEDKITQIKADGERERAKIVKNVADGTIDSSVGDKLTKSSFDKQQELIDKLQSESLKLSPFYQKLFGDIGNYGNNMLKSIIKKTEDILALAKTTDVSSKGKRTIEIDGEKHILSDEDIARMTKQLGKLRQEVAKNNPFLLLTESYKRYQEALNDPTSKEDDKSQALSQLGASAEKAGSLVKSLGSELATMFDSLGNEDLADTIVLIGDLTGSLSQIGSGIATGNPIGVIQGVIGGITSIANFHDKKLNKAIKRSQLEVKKLQNSYADLQREISRQLGSIGEKQADEMVKNQEKQLEELEYQRRKELDKKKTDRSVVADLDGQIAEAKDKLKYFYEDLAKEQWGIDIKDWSGQLADALVGAFSKGEDAAKAFDDTVANIMKSVVKNLIAASVIEPAMANLRDKLFGQGGLLAGGTTDLSNSDAVSISNELLALKSEIAKSKEIWDYINKATGGILDETQSSKGTLSKGIEGIKEDQADLLASYLNAVRADVSINKQQLFALVELSRLSNTTLGQMLLSLHAIQVNTGNTAENTLANSKMVGEIKDLLTQLTVSGSGKRINIA